MNKKAEIKNRIDLINRGEVPEGYKKVHGYIIPNDWNIVPIKKIARQVKRSVEKPSESYYRLSVRSHAKGTFHSFVENPETVAMEELFQVKENDLIVNITFAWEHAIAIVKKEDNNLLVSHRFPTYEFNSNASVKFYENIIKLPKIKKMLSDMSPGGAGKNRVLNQTDFYNSLYIPYTNFKEQEKIAKILNCCDKVIELKEKLICEEIKKNINCGRKVLKKLKGDTVEIGEILDYEQPTKYIVKNQYKNKQNEEDIPVLTANKAFIKSYTNEKFGIYDNLPVIIFDDFTVENKYVTFPFKVQSSAMKILKPKNPNINLLFVYKSMQLLKFKANDHKRYYLSEYQYMPINLPDIETQNRTVEILSKIDRKIELLQQELEQYKQLKKSLSQLLLTGIVRTVEVDCEN